MSENKEYIEMHSSLNKREKSTKKKIPLVYLISPTFLLGILFWGTLFLYLFYELGIIKSFLFDVNDIDPVGSFVYLAILFSIYIFSKIFFPLSKVKIKNTCVVNTKVRKNMLFISKLL